MGDVQLEVAVLGLTAGPGRLLLLVVLLETVVCKSRLDGILCKHWGSNTNKELTVQEAVWTVNRRRKSRNLTRTVQLNGWKTELFGDVGVLYLQSFIQLKTGEASVNPEVFLYQLEIRRKLNKILLTTAARSLTHHHPCHTAGLRCMLSKGGVLFYNLLFIGLYPLLWFLYCPH